MKTAWRDAAGEQAVTAPLSLIVSAFAPVEDVRLTLTPMLQPAADTVLLLVDLSGGRQRLGGSVLAQVLGQMGDEAPDLDDPQRLSGFFAVMQGLLRQKLVLAYHDRSDGGLLATLAEMAFAGHRGITLRCPEVDLSATLAWLFNEELGAVLQVSREAAAGVIGAFAEVDVAAQVIGTPNERDVLELVDAEGQQVFAETRVTLQRVWSEVSFEMQRLRDHPDCAREEFDALLDASDPGLHCRASFNIDDDICAPFIGRTRPRIAILREQGVNGQIEMAAAFDRADFETVDVHMSDILSGQVSLAGFQGFAACGGFSYGDVLGAGGGWAKSILFHPQARDEFARFFERNDTFALGVCNGCQMMSWLAPLIPGAEHWPRFVRNRSSQFEARVVQVEVLPSPSLFFQGMAGSVLPVVVSHGEGRARFANAEAESAALVTLRFVDHREQIATRYPANPNGSPAGVTGLTTADGRFSILMPHPERIFRAVQNSWHPSHWNEYGPWLRMFRNARKWVG